MGNLCSSCFKGQSSNDLPTPDIATLRRLQMEAAEKRQRDGEQRGIKDPERVKRQMQIAAEREKRESEAQSNLSEPKLKWQTN